MIFSFNPLLSLTFENFTFDKILKLLIILAIAFLALKIGQYLINGFFKRRRQKDSDAKIATVHSVFYSVYRVIVIFFTIIAILNNFGVNTASVLTAAGVGGIAIAFGAQQLISDVFNGIVFLLNNDINIGDYVILSGCEGNVISMSLNRIKVQGYSGIIYIIPNSAVSVVSNYRNDPVFCDLTVEVPNSIPLARAKEILEPALDKLYEENKEVFLDKPFFMGLDAVNTFSYSYRINVHALLENSWSSQRLVRMACLEALQKEGSYEHDVFSLGEKEKLNAQKSLESGKDE